MTKFHYMSDLHLEFGIGKPMLIEGDCLILAGDITTLQSLNPNKTDSDNQKIRDRTLLLFEQFQENFNKVFYLTGNHESYKFNRDLEAEYISKYLPGVIHVDNSTHIIDENTVLMGGSLWTSFNNADPLVMQQALFYMNDYRLIETNTGPFTPEDSLELHRKTMNFLTSELDKYKDKNVIVATHHSPSLRGNGKEHGAGMIHAYCSDLEMFIIDKPQIKYWIHGHTHIQDKYKVGDTNVVSNARGYVGYEACAEKFNPNTYFEI